MIRMIRLAVLAALTLGLALTLATSFSASATRGTYGQTGYGSDTVPPREIVTNASRSPGGSGGGGGSNTGVVLGVIGGLVLIGGGAAAYFIRRNGGSEATGS